MHFAAVYKGSNKHYWLLCVKYVKKCNIRLWPDGNNRLLLLPSVYPTGIKTTEAVWVEMTDSFTKAENNNLRRWEIWARSHQCCSPAGYESWKYPQFSLRKRKQQEVIWLRGRSVCMYPCFPPSLFFLSPNSRSGWRVDCNSARVWLSEQ